MFVGNEDGIWNKISVEKLAELIDQLKGKGLSLTPSRVGNLSIINESEQYKGYIDITAEEVCYAEDTLYIAEET